MNQEQKRNTTPAAVELAIIKNNLSLSAPKERERNTTAAAVEKRDSQK